MLWFEQSERETTGIGVCSAGCSAQPTTNYVKIVVQRRSEDWTTVILVVVWFEQSERETHIGVCTAIRNIALPATNYVKIAVGKRSEDWTAVILVCVTV